MRVNGRARPVGPAWARDHDARGVRELPEVHPSARASRLRRTEARRRGRRARSRPDARADGLGRRRPTRCFSPAGIRPPGRTSRIAAAQRGFMGVPAPDRHRASRTTPGNMMFNTLGNLAADPTRGTAGRGLRDGRHAAAHRAGGDRVGSGSGRARFAGAQRLVEFDDRRRGRNPRRRRPGHSSRSRYPTPGSVSSSRGRAGSASIFCRSWAM